MLARPHLLIVLHLQVLHLRQPSPHQLYPLLLFTHFVLFASHRLFELAEFLEFALAQVVGLVYSADYFLRLRPKLPRLFLSVQDARDGQQLCDLALLSDAGLNLLLVVAETFYFDLLVALLLQRIRDLSELALNR